MKKKLLMIPLVAAMAMAIGGPVNAQPSQVAPPRAIVKSGVQASRTYPVNDPLLVRHP